MQQQTNFFTDDLNLAAILILRSIEPIKIDTTNPLKSVFEFEFTDPLLAVINEYFSKKVIDNINQFLMVRRKLMISIKTRANVG